MPNDTEHRVHALLQQIPECGLEAVKALFWTELNYDRVNEPLPTRTWPEAVRRLLAGEPLLLARHTSALGTFDIIAIRLTPEATGQTSPLSLAAERTIVTHLLPAHPYALFVFSDADGHTWHLVNVKTQRPQTASGPSSIAPAPAQPVIRRIAIGPSERLRTAAERLAMLDLASLPPDDLSPMAIQQRHDTAFDVEVVTRTFFTAYRQAFERTENSIRGLDDPEEARLFTQRLFNRLLFIVFLERKGWLRIAGRSDYLRALWESYRDAPLAGETNFYADRLKLLFFSGLNNPGSVDITGITAQGFLSTRIGQVPYLNGGLFEREELDDRTGVTVPDATFADLVTSLLYAYNFTVTESTPLDVEVAVDPEMLGKIFEELVTGRHETGSYYTPKPIVAFMCREALKAYLRDTCPDEPSSVLTAFVEERDAADLRRPESVLAALRHVRVCDPACGSGAYLLGMLHELVALRQALFASRAIDAGSTYARKLEIIQQNLYGVDIDPFAVNIARLRLWLSLMVDFDDTTPPPLPNLEFKIEVGDSLTAPAPAPLQPDLFRQQDVARFFELKGAFLRAHGPEKTQLRAEITTLKASIAAWASEESGADAFDWAVDFAEVFTPQGDVGIPGAPGFDIIVANPPYVRQELQTPEQKARYRQRYPGVYTGTADLYVAFYGRALQLLRRGGVASFITSNKWLRAGYGKKLREHLAGSATVDTIIDFGDLPVFGAIAYPQIIVFRRTAPSRGATVRALTVEDLGIVDRLGQAVAEEGWSQAQSTLRADGWALVRPAVSALMAKLRCIGKPLGELLGGRIYYGIKTGYNQAFVIDGAARDRLVAEDARSAEIVRPWIRGRDIDRWRTMWSGEYLIFTRRGVDIDSYPAIKRHLSQFRDRLEPGVEGGRKPGNYQWYEIQDTIDYYEVFDGPKIVYPHFNTRPEFAYDNSGTLGNDKTYVMPHAPLYLLGLLNSCVAFFYFRQVCPSVQQRYMEFRIIYLEQTPIPDASPADRAAIEGLVRRLLDLHTGPEPPDPTAVAALEAELNARVYALYDLTPAEIALIEETTDV